MMIICWLSVSCEGKVNETQKREDEQKNFKVKQTVTESKSEHKHGTRRTFYSGDNSQPKVCFDLLCPRLKKFKMNYSTCRTHLLEILVRIQIHSIA